MGLSHINRSPQVVPVVSRKITEKSRENHGNITGISRENHEKITGKSQEYHRNITGISQEYDRKITGISQEYHRIITGISQEYHRKITGISQEYHRNITGKYCVLPGGGPINVLFCSFVLAMKNPPRDDNVRPLLCVLSQC